MDLLSGLASLMGGGGSSQFGAQQQSGGLGSMLTGLLGAAAGGGGSGGQCGGGGLGALGGLFNPTMLAGLAGALLGGGRTSAAGGLGGLGSLLGGLFGGAPTPALDKHKDFVMQADPRYGGQIASNPADRVMRLLRAIVYAAKADGHIDQNEQNAITSFLQKNNIGQEGTRIIQDMINDPLDPAGIAYGLQDSQEAVQIYGMSCVVCGNDHPAERRYLDDLARAMGIPANVKTDIERQVGF